MDCREKGELTSTMEDYLEAVWSIEEKDGVTRVKDISEIMNVSPPTVNAAMKCLKKRSLIKQEIYGYIKLTTEGRKIAKDIQRRHKLLTRFLGEILGLEEKIAKTDACKLEHCVSGCTIERIVRFLEFFDRHSEKQAMKWLKTFHASFSKKQDSK